MQLKMMLDYSVEAGSGLERMAMGLIHQMQLKMMLNYSVEAGSMPAVVELVQRAFLDSSGKRQVDEDQPVEVVDFAAVA